jgi:hypothetical protein
MVKLNVPEEVGDPLMTPPFDKVSPGGRLPAETVQLKGGGPPFAVRVAEYGWFTVPLGSDVVAICVAPFRIAAKLRTNRNAVSKDLDPDPIIEMHRTWKVSERSTIADLVKGIQSRAGQCLDR